MSELQPSEIRHFYNDPSGVSRRLAALFPKKTPLPFVDWLEKHVYLGVGAAKRGRLTLHPAQRGPAAAMADPNITTFAAKSPHNGYFRPCWRGT